MTSPEAYLAALRELHVLTTQLKSAAADKDWERLVALLEQRQTVMDQADQAHPSDWRPTVQEAQEAARLLGEVGSMDEELSGAVEKILLEARAQLQTMETTRSTITAYQRVSRTAAQLPEARFVDKQR